MLDCIMDSLPRFFFSKLAEAEFHYYCNEITEFQMLQKNITEATLWKRVTERDRKGSDPNDEAS